LDLLIQEAYLLRAPAQIMLRLIYKYGLENKFVPYDPRILAHYQRVVGDGIPRDQFYLAEMYYYELGVERDVQYARKLVENNSLEDAQELLFAIYYEQEEKELAEEITRQAADNDYSWGAYNYGVLMIEKGNHKEAVEYFHKTLEIDPEYWEAMLNLGQAYIEGWGVEEDPLKGFLFYKNVADDGPEGEKATLIGLHVTGMLYLEGIGISKDSELGIAYLKKSASGGYEKSKQFLADYNRDDSKNTFEEWKELAKQGNTEAQARLGLMHQFGWEASQDHVEAVKWFRLAAEQGDARSQYNLGWMFSKGKGVSLDFAQAHMWFNLAEANGYKDGRKKRILIENKMTPEQIAEAQKLAKEWEQKSWEEILASNDFPDMKKRFSEDNKTENLNLASKAPHESNSEKSVSVVSEKWEHKDWATNYYPDMGLVRFISHGLILYSHQFGFIKQSGNCDTDILWISWPAYDEKVKIFEGKEMTLKMDVDGTSFEIPIELLVLNTIFRDSMIMNFTNSSGESQFTDLIKKGKKVTVSIVGPENFEEYLGALSPSFSLNGFIANQLKAKEFCEKQEVNTRNKLTKEKKV
jgi:TPR repeat protein